MNGNLRLGPWQPVVVEAVRVRYQNTRTAEKVTAETARLFRFLAACGAECWGRRDFGTRVGVVLGGVPSPFGSSSTRRCGDGPQPPMGSPHRVQGGRGGWERR